MWNVPWGDVGLVGIFVAIIGYQWRQNANLRAQRESDLVTRIEASINNLAETIKESTNKFDNTVSELWSHIGTMDKKLSKLIGQHEINHKSMID